MARTTLFGYTISKAAGAKRGKAAARGGKATSGRKKSPRARGKVAETRGKPAERRAKRAKEAKSEKAPPAPPAPQIPAVLRVLAMLVAFAAMVAFAVVLAKLTLVPSAASEPLTHSNLTPGDSIRNYVSQPAFRDTVKQIGGNILLGVPFGLLLPVLVPRARGLLRVGAATALVMVLVELTQGALVTGRAFDIDDVLLNTLGALLGYLLLGRRLGRAVHPRRPHWWHRYTRRPAAG
ncbi:VanZ family protein [Streptomyces sp. NPDC004647]|uniref:VanZ family protein n=1 Tax=Streptomyces sp. NPDC004647 TaxID=3154671 RepID=UPI0033AE3339